MRGVQLLADQSRLKKLAFEVLDILGVSGTPEIFIVSSSEMRTLKRKYLGIDHDTNVLAFPFPKDFPQPKGERQLGEIYLSPNYIKKHNESIEFMLIHGLLHLLGFDHQNARDRRKMENLENTILIKLKIKNKSAK